jgi:hypothetical protein
MSRDVFPTQIQVPVFFMIRLCANAEIGVPRGELPFSVLPASPRHSCEGRNLNQGMDVLTYISP